MSDRLKIRKLDCSTTYLTPSKTTTITKRTLAKESMIRVFQALLVIKRKADKIAQVRREVQNLIHPTVDVMATVT